MHSKTKPMDGDDQSAESKYLIEMLASLLRIPQVHRSRRTRVAAMAASIRILAHSNNKSHLNLPESVIGQCCLQALRSSSRDLRIAAGYSHFERSRHLALLTHHRRTLIAFLLDDIDYLTLKQNKIYALEFLRILSEKGELALQETCILAWGQLARYDQKSLIPDTVILIYNPI